MSDVFAERLRFARMNRHKRPEEVGVAIGKSASAVLSYERGDRSATAPIIRALAEELAVSADWLLGLTDAEPTWEAEAEPISKPRFFDQWPRFAERLGLERERRTMTHSQLAVAIGRSPGSVRGYEQGKQVPSLDVLRQLCDVFGVTLEYLLGSADKAEGAPERERLDMDVVDVAAEVIRTTGPDLLEPGRKGQPAPDHAPGARRQRGTQPRPTRGL